MMYLSYFGQDLHSKENAVGIPAHICFVCFTYDTLCKKMDDSDNAGHKGT